MENNNLIENQIAWNVTAQNIWNEFIGGGNAQPLENQDESQYVVEKLTYLMEHNAEKYRDIEGIEIYKNITNYIQDLKNLHNLS